MAGVGLALGKFLPGHDKLNLRSQRTQNILAKVLAGKQCRQAAVGFGQLFVRLFVEQVAGPEPHR